MFPLSKPKPKKKEPRLEDFIIKVKQVRPGVWRNPRGRVSTHWMVHYPDEFYAHDLLFKVPLSEKKVREYLREYHDVKTLPRGTEIYTNHPM